MGGGGANRESLNALFWTAYTDIREKFIIACK